MSLPANINFVPQILSKHRSFEPDLRTRDAGLTPLLLAVSHGHGDAALLLLQKNASVEQAANDGTTPLAMACLVNETEVAEILLEHQADPNVARSTLQPQLLPQLLLSRRRVGCVCCLRRPTRRVQFALCLVLVLDTHALNTSLSRCHQCQIQVLHPSTLQRCTTMPASWKNFWKQRQCRPWKMSSILQRSRSERGPVACTFNPILIMETCRSLSAYAFARCLAPYFPRAVSYRSLQCKDQ